MLISKISNINKMYFQGVCQGQNATRAQTQKDYTDFKSPVINKKPLVDRKIISENQDISSFYNEISNQIFPNSHASHSLSQLLQMGYVSLSSNAYGNIKDPKSAIGIKLDSNKNVVSHCSELEKYVKNGVGIGINFSQIQNPISEIKYINNYFKYREPSLNRPPAGIALLNIDNPNILEFIGLKDNADYKNWCFDLSVVMDSEFLKKVDNEEYITLSNGKALPAKEIYIKLLNSMAKSGEPGIIFSDDKEFICDSCAAAQLQENEGLNLAHINLAKFYDEKTQKIDYNHLSQSANILSQALKTIAPNGFVGILGYQDLLNKMGLNYGSKDALTTLENCLEVIKGQTKANGLRMALSPTGTVSRILKTTPSIEPVDNKNSTYWDEIDTMTVAQKYLDGGISKTINLKPHHTIQDIDLIIRACQKNNLKGISVFPAQ